MKSKSIKVSGDEILGSWVTPPESQGQMSPVEYASTEHHILRRKGGSIVAYAWPSRDTAFAPWNGAPKLGRRAGKVQLV